ncbi:MAG: hypothetical protein ABII25_06145 [bacterium]
MLQILLNNKVKFLVVGAYAMGVHGYPRATGDFDIWVEASIDNSKKICLSLAEFGAPLKGVSQDAFSTEGIVLQVGVPPRRIDIITKIDGVNFKQAYNDREDVEIEDLKVPFISKDNLIKNKESTGRDKDKLDLKYLKKLTNK